MAVYERIKKVVKWLVGIGIAQNQEGIGKLLGYNNKSSFSQVLNGKVPLPNDFIHRLGLLDKNINTVWIEKGEGEMLNPPRMESNAVVKDITDSSPTKAPLIGQYAYAGYLSGFADNEYLEAQPIYVASKRYSGGNYVAFEIRGDSMDDNTRRAICHGDVVLAKELKKDYWKSKLHIPKVFVIVHREEGITCKEVIEHNVETGDIVCHSWNSTHRDFTLNLKDVMQLFYLKEIKRDVI